MASKSVHGTALYLLLVFLLPAHSNCWSSPHLRQDAESGERTSSYNNIPTIQCRTGVDLLNGPKVACANQCMNTTSPHATVLD